MPTSQLVVGASGMLGSAITGELRRRGAQAARVVVPWADARAAADALARALPVGAEAVRIWWCAGVGVTTSTPELMRAERQVLRSFADAVVGYAGRPGTRVELFYASSAGGLYAGSASPPFDESTPPVPLSAYGESKLLAEAVIGSLAEAGVRVGIGRLANLYGPGQDLSKPQGLISQLCVARHSRRPLNIYVSLDTLRDYIFASDAAALCVDFMDAVALRDSGVTTKVLASGRAVSIAELLAEMRRIFKKGVPVNLIASAAAKQQARDLRLSSQVLTELDRRSLITLPAGIQKTDFAIGGRFRSGLLAR
jgi:Nucleoside-diphosphate-sugar epimerases